MGYGPFVLDEELLLPSPPKEVALGAKGKNDFVVVLTLVGLDHCKGHGNVLVLATVLTGGLPGRLHGQDTSLGKRDVVNGLTFAGEVELLFFLALVFGHGGIIEDVGVGSNGELPRNDTTGAVKTIAIWALQGQKTGNVTNVFGQPHTFVHLATRVVVKAELTAPLVLGVNDDPVSP